MTAEEIRAQASEISAQEFGSDAIWCRALLEIAAQLAELNLTAKIVAHDIDRLAETQEEAHS